MIGRDQPYIHFYVNDFLADEKLRECSAESIGVYIMLMCILHKQVEYGTILLKQKDKQNCSTCLNFALKLAKQLPFDVATIERALIELIEVGVLHLEGDKLIQRRMVKDAQLSQKRAAAGKKGGEVRAQKSKDFAKVFAKGFALANTDNDYDNDNNNINNKNNISVKSKTDAKKEHISELFNTFWNEYPRKVAKAKAKKAWETLKPTDELFADIMRALRQQKQSDQWRRDGGQYIPHPTTWLNQRRWEDEMEEITRGTDWSNNGCTAKTERTENPLEGFVMADETAFAGQI